MYVLHRFQVFVPANKGISQPAFERAGTVERQGSHKIRYRAGMDFLERGAHARRFDLETTDGTPGGDQRGGFRVYTGDGIE